jgi:hypothetical protein
MVLNEMTDLSLRARFLRHWRPIAAIAAAVVVIGAFLLWGPIGIGNGPLNMGTGIGQGGTLLHGEQRVAFAIPVQNHGHAAAVVDSVQFKAGPGFPSPQLPSLWAISFSHCGGAWPVPARPGPPRLQQGCGRALGPLIGHSFGYDYLGDMGLAEASVPSPTGCWVITAVVVHYHVGIRHYAATDPFGFSFCGARASSALQQAADQAAG